MKILFLTKSFYPNIGGVEKHCYELGQKIIKSGHELFVITETRENFLSNKEVYDKINIFRIKINKPEKIKKFQIWLWLLKNIHLLKEAEIIHCHDVFYWFLPFKLFFWRKKVFVTFHGYEGNEPPTITRIFQHKIAEILSNGNICIGDFHKKWYKVKPTYVSYGATNENKINISPKKYLFDYCFIGRLAKDTGIDVYLKSFNLLKLSGLNKSLVVCGDGPLFEESRAYCLKKKLNVKFLGFINNPEYYLYKSKQIFTSRYLGIIEALMYKKLVFAVYDNDIKKDYLKMAPFSKWIIVEKEPELLVQKLMQNINRSVFLSMNVDQAYSWAKRQSWTAMKSLYFSLWGIK